MSYLHDSHGLDARAVLLAVEHQPSRANLQWLRSRQMPSSALFESLFKAVELERTEAIEAFIRFGGVSANYPVSVSITDETTGSVGQGETSMLCWAIENNKLDAARTLINEGAGVHGESGLKKAATPSLQKQPVWLAMDRYGAGHEPASLSLLIKLLRTNAQVNTSHLTHAMSFVKPYGTRLFKTLLLNSDAQPKDLTEASSLLKVAKNNQLLSVQAILTEISLMLQQDVLWSQSERKAKDAEFHFVALARERALRFVELDDDDVDPDLLENVDLPGLSEDGVGALSLLRRPERVTDKWKQKVKAPEFLSKPSPSNQLIKTKKTTRNA